MHALFFVVLITVTGHGQASANPDMATETFTVATNAATAVKAASENASRYTTLLERLHALGIAPADIRTASYSMYYTPPAPANVPNPNPQPTGYFVNRQETVTIHNLSWAGRAVDAAIGAGVAGVDGISFGVSDTRSLYGRALTSAVADARSQASAMAQAAGLHIVRIHRMDQGTPPVRFPAPVAMMRTAEVAPPTQIEPSSVSQGADVTVVYEAQ